MRFIQLESADKDIFVVDYETIKCSETIRMAVQDLGDKDDCGVLPVPKVSSPILEKVIIWATYHQNDLPMVAAEEDKLEEEKRTDDISAWDIHFLNVDQNTLFDLILAANYLNIQGLLTIANKTVANMIKGKTTEQIRQTFSLVNDFTPEEEEEMRRQMDLCQLD